jgi:hypothetical protein
MPEGVGDLQLKFNYEDTSKGTLDCTLIFEGQSHRFSPWLGVPPFTMLQDFIRALYTQRLPYRMFWDEEGPATHFEAWPAGVNGTHFHFYVYYEEAGQIYPWVNAKFERQAVIDVFMEALSDMVEHTDDEFQQWWGIGKSDIDSLQALFQHPLPSRTDVKGQEDIQFSFGAVVGIELYKFTTALWLVSDYGAFWPYWFSLLQKIATGRMPSHFKFHDFEHDTAFEESLEYTEPGYVRYVPSHYTVRADPVPEPEHFRLRCSEFGPRGEWLMLDEVFDRISFVRAFLRDFEAYLEIEYEYQPRGDVPDFDLRDLPLDELKSLLE